MRTPTTTSPRRLAPRAALCALAVLGGLAASGTAQAQSRSPWVPVGRTDAGTLYVDGTAVTRLYPEQPVVEIRTRVQFPAPLASGATHSVSREVVDCSRLAQRTLSTDWFDDQGQLRARRPATITVEQAVEAMSAERLEYSARLSMLCPAIARLGAQGAIVEPKPPAPPEAAPVVVPLRGLEGLHNRVRARVNDREDAELVLVPEAPLTMLPKAVFERLRKAGALADADVLGKRPVRGPDGRPVTMTVVKLKSLAVGEHTMPDVEAAVVESGGAGVLGQSFLNRLARWKVDSAKKTLEFVP